MKKTVTVLIGYGSPTLTGLEKLENKSVVIANSTLFSSKNYITLSSYTKTKYALH